MMAVLARQRRMLACRVLLGKAATAKCGERQQAMSNGEEIFKCNGPREFGDDSYCI